jgi:Protein of unknown function (DUF3800)
LDNAGRPTPISLAASVTVNSGGQEYPIFVLAFCIFRKSDYVRQAVPALQDFKFRWFGHDLVILHENEIVKRKPPFAFLQFNGLRERFMGELTGIIDGAPMTVIAAAIGKDALKRRYARPDNPYQLALLFCLERTRDFLCGQGAIGTAHVVCEARSPREKGRRMGKEDQELELEFCRIVAGKHPLQRRNGEDAMPEFDIVFTSKQTNSSGIQIADLLARPIGLSVLRPQQPNRAFDIIKCKLWLGPEGTDSSFGLKVFP